MGMEKAMAPLSSPLAWRVPWMEEPGGLQSMGSLRAGHDWVTSLSLFTFIHWRRNWQCSCLENPRDGGAWCAAVYGVAQSRTWLKWLSSRRLMGNNQFSAGLKESYGFWGCLAFCHCCCYYYVQEWCCLWRSTATSWAVAEHTVVSWACQQLESKLRFLASPTANASSKYF